MDVFTGASTPDGLALDARIGGSPLNVARGLARLGQPVSFLGGISNGSFGQRIMSALETEGVSTKTVHRSDAPTTLSLVAVDSRGVPDYAFYGQDAADRNLPLEALVRIPPSTRALHVGSYAMVVGETGRTQRALVDAVRGRAIVSYDPNVRLNVEPAIELWRETLAWMLTRTDVLKLSEDDLALLHPGVDAESFAAMCLSRGVRIVALTSGGRGALAWHANGRCEASAVPVDVVDTVGAGDTFQAALLTRLAELGALSHHGLRDLTREALKDVVGFATRAAAITCSRRGADLPRRIEIAQAD